MDKRRLDMFGLTAVARGVTIHMRSSKMLHCVCIACHIPVHGFAFPSQGHLVFQSLAQEVRTMWDPMLSCISVCSPSFLSLVCGRIVPSAAPPPKTELSVTIVR